MLKHFDFVNHTLFAIAASISPFRRLQILIATPLAAIDVAESLSSANTETVPR